MSTNQTTTANITERHTERHTTESCTQESSEHRDERLRLQRERSRVACEQHVARYRAQDQERQQTRRALTQCHYYYEMTAYIVIRAYKTPSGEHAGKFNAPTVEEVVIIIVCDQLITELSKSHVVTALFM
ncbi:hypothetical protein CEXT_286961 [Caerostris extrusa]|uniref:Uncharacterized protein n=1 Tax=Caerostris extrusa TaxID=172846 RepID=A0AAV4VDR5_CAEEX|nr:hypothetical protein CEXT_286961 [Caerostris extrusa]